MARQLLLILPAGKINPWHHASCCAATSSTSELLFEVRRIWKPCLVTSDLTSVPTGLQYFLPELFLLSHIAVSRLWHRTDMCMQHFFSHRTDGVPRHLQGLPGHLARAQGDLPDLSGESRWQCLACNDFWHSTVRLSGEGYRQRLACVGSAGGSRRRNQCWKLHSDRGASLWPWAPVAAGKAV